MSSKLDRSLYLSLIIIAILKFLVYNYFEIIIRNGYMKIIGITGSSGSGKSTISKIIADELNAKLIIADEVVKIMQKPNEKYYKKIVKLVGKDYLDEKGYLNRTKLANLIFEDAKIRNKLNKLTNKYVVSEIKAQVKSSNLEYVIIDAPLLIESKLNKICNLTIVVIADYDTKIERICTRDEIEKDMAKVRLNAQPNDDFYKENVDYVIENNGGDYDKLLGRIRTILQQL